MKIYSLGLLFVLLLLTACSQNNGDATIREAELTGDERVLTEVVGNQQSFLYELELNNEDIQEIQMSVDYYEDGSLVKEILKTTTSTEEFDMNEARIMFIKQGLNEAEEKWISTLMDEKGSFKTEALNDMRGREQMRDSQSVGVAREIPINIGEEKVVAAVIHSNNEINVNETIETEDEFQQAVSYEQVYLLSIELN